MSHRTEALSAAVRRQAATSPDESFARQALLDDEMDRIVADAGSEGATPHQTMSRELQELRDAGLIAFVDNRETYRLIA